MLSVSSLFAKYTWAEQRIQINAFGFFFAFLSTSQKQSLSHCPYLPHAGKPQRLSREMDILIIENLFEDIQEEYLGCPVILSNGL